MRLRLLKDHERGLTIESRRLARQVVVLKIEMNVTRPVNPLRKGLSLTRSWSG